MTTDKHPAEALAAYAEMWACGGVDHNARCADVAAMLRTIPALEAHSRQQALEYITLDGQCAELIAERDKLRTALCEIANADMTTKGFQMMAREALAGAPIAFGAA